MTFTIAHLSDAHLSPAPFPGPREMRLKRFMGYVNWKRGRERLNDMAMLARLVADLRAQNPDHVAMTGDAVNLALAAEFDRAAIWMKTLGDPANVSFTPGNHDAYVRDAMEGLARVFAPWTSGNSRAPGVEPFPYLRVRGEIAVIGLNSGVPTAPLMASGRLGRRQLASLGRMLEDTGARGLARVILIHHPPLSRGASPRCAASTTHANSSGRSPTSAPRQFCMATRTSGWCIICLRLRRAGKAGSFPSSAPPPPRRRRQIRASAPATT